MKTRPFGRTDLRVSEFGLGCARLGGFFASDPNAATELVSAALDGDINFFDTADMYSQGESETLLGRALRGRRGRVVLTTKAGYRLPGQRKLLSYVKPLLRPIVKRLGIRRENLPGAVTGTISQDFSPEYLTKAVEASLKRLRTDYVDLLQLHSPPKEIIVRGEWSDALERLKQAGKVRYYGISCDTLDAGLAALSFQGVSSLQYVINLLEPAASVDLLPAAHAQGVATIAREALANGLLVKSEAEIDFDKYCESDAERALKKQALAEHRSRASAEGRSLANLALGYVRGLDGVSTTLIGARNARQLTDVLTQLTP